jgi:hypothetical protein
VSCTSKVTGAPLTSALTVTEIAHPALGPAHGRQAMMA